MKYLVTKIPLIPLTKEQFINLVKTLHQIDDIPIQSIISYFSLGWVIDCEDIIAFHLEDDCIYEYIYHAKEHQLYISIDCHLSYDYIDMIDALITHQYIVKDSEFYVDEKAFSMTSAKRFIDYVKHNQTLPIVFLQHSTIQFSQIRERLAKRLKGMAYVVWANEDIEREIFEHFHLTNQNYIFYLNDEYQRFSLLKNETEEEFIERIFIKVQNYITKRVYAFPYSMNELYKYALKQMIKDVKNKENLVAVRLENQLTALEISKEEYIERIEKLKNKISIIQNQNENMIDFLKQQDEYPMILKGDEKELYEGEQKGL